MTSKSFENKAENPWTDFNCDEKELQNLLDKPLEGIAKSRLRDGEHHKGFDNNLGDTWIYPSNLPCRSYQLSIVQTALYRNTLVVLPTGLGKTFIAAVVMYNIYRWYPCGKVIFMAPTRPLVNQQIEACQKIMPFPRKDTVELTGKIPKAKRIELWKTKRVFFATPHVVQSDILGGQVRTAEDESSILDDCNDSYKTEFPFDAIKLIVIDEAHKAKGKYAFTEVAQALAENTKYFRVLALSATPGRTMEDVAEVCRNLMISHIEVRWETSIDVLPYVHKRNMETVVVALGERIKELKTELLEIIDPYLRQLIECNVLSGSLTNINRNFLVFQQKSFQERSIHHGRHPQHSAIVSNFAICISLYHSMELLERHGTRVFLNYFEENEDGKAKFVIQMERRLRDLVDRLKEEVGPNPFDVSAGPMTNGEIAEIPRDLDFGHPKFEKARECLLKHFNINKESRAIVFCEYRESVLLIFRMLLQHKPLLRPRCFVGQGGTGTLRALTQKQQIQIMSDFRSGKSNILIATSIGEEGIDVGEVDLIVCFDISTSNPTRFIQRIGRTGRQKNGNVMMLVTEGREQQILKDVLNNKDQINKKILRSSVVQQSLYKHSPRMVPTEFKPKCVQTFVTPSEEEKYEEEEKKSSSKNKSGKQKNSEKGTQDLRKFFNKKPAAPQPPMDAEDLEYFEINSKYTQAKPGIMTQQKMERNLNSIKNIFKDLQSPIPTQIHETNSKNKRKLNCSSPSATIELSDDSPEKTPIKKKLLNTSQGSIKNFFQDSKISEISTTNCHNLAQNNFWDDFKVIWKKTITTPSIIKRAKIDNLVHHLKSSELSKDMKYLLLCQKPEFIKKNLEQVNILKAIQDLDNSNATEEEKSIKDLHNEILYVFDGLENLEKFLEDNDLDDYKTECLRNDIFSSEEEEDSENERQFENNLENIFINYNKETLNSSQTYEWVKQKFRETLRYKEMEKSKLQGKIQESMVYGTVLENTNYDYDTTENGFEESNNFLDSKYCSQWQEFNKPDLAFKSTPLQGPLYKKSNIKDGSCKTSLFTKLEELKEEDEQSMEKVNKKPLMFLELDSLSETNPSLNNSNKFLDSLKKCETSLNSLLEQRKHNEDEEKDSSSNNLLVDELTNSTDSNKTTGSLVPFETDPDFNTTKINKDSVYNKTLTNNIKIGDNFEEEEDLLFKAAMEAELRFSQAKTNMESSQNKSKGDLNSPNEIKYKKNNPTHNKTPPSLNSTPEIEDFQKELTKNKSSEISLQNELDVDMAAFMEPFPEEQELLKISNISANRIPENRRESLKENFLKDIYTRESPDIFGEEHMKSPNVVLKKPVPQKPSLASKLSAKLKSQPPPRSQSDLTDFKKPASMTSDQGLLRPTHTNVHLTSPTSRLPTSNLKNDKSPSVFDMYLRNAKGKIKLPKSLANSSVSSSMSLSKKVESEKSPMISCSQNDSPIMARKRNTKGLKRKIFDSDTDETDESHGDVTVIETNGNGRTHYNSDCEEVAATQAPDDSSIFQRRKRRRFNSFIEQEAALSGSEASEDEEEHSIGGYLLDSVVVQSDDEDEDQASTSHMQGMYLQSLKSPPNRRGAFKIPAQRVYNDHSRIFSQNVLPEEICSQYIPDSFIVHEDDSFIHNNNDGEESLCPLEKAERILKERRKAKRKEKNLISSESDQKQQKRLKKVVIDDSSDDDFC